MVQRSFAIQSATIHGVEAIPVMVEVVISNGIPSFSIVGMADVTIMESRERIKAALRASGFVMPTDKVVVNLAPGALRKTGSGFDLPIALGILAATGQIPLSSLRGTLVVGELSLDGSVRATAGMLAYQNCALKNGWNLLTGVSDQGILAMEGLTCSVLERLVHIVKGRYSAQKGLMVERSCEQLDYADVIGHEAAKRALQVAAAGGHGVLMVGPPGSGKTMLAQRFGSILPELTEAERIEAALVHSVAGKDISAILAGQRPFRSPHHSATSAGMIGGGKPPHPGEASLAHHGVLFLDELAEFRSSVLQMLRQPLEMGSILLTRADGTYTFPAQFQLIAATNPCPCGYYGDPSGKCHCGASVVQSYQNRMGGPLIDRIDIRIDVWRESSDELFGSHQGRSSVDLREGVERARSFAQKRLATQGGSGRGLRELKRRCDFNQKAEDFFLSLAEKRDMSARSISKTLLLSRTIADLSESKHVKEAHIAEAFALRFGGGLQ